MALSAISCTARWVVLAENMRGRCRYSRVVERRAEVPLCSRKAQWTQVRQGDDVAGGEFSSPQQSCWALTVESQHHPAVAAEATNNPNAKRRFRNPFTLNLPTPLFYSRWFGLERVIGEKSISVECAVSHRESVTISRGWRGGGDKSLNPLTF